MLFVGNSKNRRLHRCFLSVRFLCIINADDINLERSSRFNVVSFLIFICNLDCVSLKQQKERQSVHILSPNNKMRRIVPLCAVLATKFHLLTCHRILGISLHICCGTLSLFPFFPDFLPFCFVPFIFSKTELPRPLSSLPSTPHSSEDCLLWCMVAQQSRIRMSHNGKRWLSGGARRYLQLA